MPQTSARFENEQSGCRRSPAISPRVIAVLLAMAFVAGCTESATSPAELVGDFYAVRLELETTGAPGPGELARLEPYLSTELRDLLARARKRRDDDATRAPAEKPSFAEGDLFSSLFEGPTSFKVGADEATGDVHRVSVQLAYELEQPVVSWTDKVVVTKETGKWVIADIEYGGNWEFGNRGSLVSGLKAVLTPAAVAGALGEWAVAGHRIPGASAMDSVQAATLHGRMLKYEAETASSGKDVCPKASYKSRDVPAAEYLATQHRISPQSIGLQAGDARLGVTEVTCGGVDWDTLGGVLLQVSGRRAFAPWNGVFFELQRK